MRVFSAKAAGGPPEAPAGAEKGCRARGEEPRCLRPVRRLLGPGIGLKCCFDGSYRFQLFRAFWNFHLFLVLPLWKGRNCLSLSYFVCKAQEVFAECPSDKPGPPSAWSLGSSAPSPLPNPGVSVHRAPQGSKGLTLHVEGLLVVSRSPPARCFALFSWYSLCPVCVPLMAPHFQGLVV